MNRRHAAFVRHYLEDPERSVTRACQRAGLSPGSNDGLAWRLFSRPDIQAAIETGVEGMQLEYTTTVDALHDIVTKIMHAQDADGRGPTGQVLPIVVWPDGLAESIRSLEFDPDGNLVSFTRITRGPAIQQAAKNENMLEQADQEQEPIVVWMSETDMLC